MKTGDPREDRRASLILMDGIFGGFAQAYVPAKVYAQGDDADAN